MNECLLTIFKPNGEVESRIVVNDCIENPDLKEIKAKGINENWRVEPVKIISVSCFGFDWWVRVTPTTFELTDADRPETAATANVFDGAEVGHHILGNPHELDTSTITESLAWSDWWDIEAYPAMTEYAAVKLN